jgi:hypothetical protein
LWREVQALEMSRWKIKPRAEKRVETSAGEGLVTEYLRRRSNRKNAISNGTPDIKSCVESQKFFPGDTMWRLRYEVLHL